MDHFNAKILRLFVKGGIYEDSAQVAWYRSKLPGFLRDKMALVYPQPTTMDQWMETAIQLNKAYLLLRRCPVVHWLGFQHWVLDAFTQRNRGSEGSEGQ